MSHPATDDLALDLFADWEDRRARGDSVSVEEVCVRSPQLLGAVREIARRIAGLPWLRGHAAESTDSIHPGACEPGAPGWVEIGRGASSIVYRAHDKDLGTVVAYKVLHPRDGLLTATDTLRLMRRFELEARILARLKHQGIVRIFKTFFHEGRPALEMEYLPGGTLATRQDCLREQGVQAIARFLEQVARAVGFAHAQGIVHRDLKPTNILLDSDGRPCVSDFGVAKLLDHREWDAPSRAVRGEHPSDASDLATCSITRNCRQPGTWAYMAPEQFDPTVGAVTPATDVWALGVILYELVSGTPPFAAANRSAIQHAVCFESMPSLRGGPRGSRSRRLVRVIRTCLEKRPGHRYPNAQKLAEALRELATSGRGWLSRVSLVMAAGVVLGVASDSTPRPAPHPATPSGSPSTRAWWDHPEIRGVETKLGQGKPVVLIDKETPPAVFHWARGEGASRVLQVSGVPFAVHSDNPGGALLELLPRLPHGLLNGGCWIEAVLKHERANGLSWAGLYCGGTHWVSSGGEQHTFAQARFADVGGYSGWVAGSTSVLENRRTHLVGVFLGDNPKAGPITSVQSIAQPPVGPVSEAPARGWRTVSLTLDWKGVKVTQGADELVGELGMEAFDQVLTKARGQTPELGSDRRFDLAGGVGLYIHRGTLHVERLSITPLAKTE